METQVGSAPKGWANRYLVATLGITRGYAIVASLLLAGLAIQIAQLQFSTDFWVHAPAVAEFMANPTDPNHIYVTAKVPHYALNAYHWVVAAAAGLFDLEPIRAMQFAGAINAAALLLFLPQFVRTFVDDRRAPLVALLVLTLAWGPGAWRFSGFLNLNSIGFGVPYPSYFALWVSFLVVWAFRRLYERKRLVTAQTAFLSTAAFLVANVHPITFGGLVIFVTALFVSRPSTLGLMGMASILLGGLASAAIWPFFDSFEAAAVSQFQDAENRDMYEMVVIRTAPALLGLIPLASRFIHDRRNPLVVAFATAVLIYAAGWVFDRETYGRVLVFAVLALQLALTEAIVKWLDRERSPTDRRLASRLGFAVLIAAGLALAAPALVRMVPLALLPERVNQDPRLDTDFDWVIPAGELIEYGEVVLAPPGMSTQFAAVGAKLVTFRPVAFIRDQMQRREDAVSFFADPDPTTLAKYDVDWIAFASVGIPSPTRSHLESFGRHYEIGEVVLIEVDR